MISKGRFWRAAILLLLLGGGFCLLALAAQAGGNSYRQPWLSLLAWSLPPLAALGMGAVACLDGLREKLRSFRWDGACWAALLLLLLAFARILSYGLWLIWPAAWNGLLEIGIHGVGGMDVLAGFLASFTLAGGFDKQ